VRLDNFLCLFAFEMSTLEQTVIDDEQYPVSRKCESRSHVTMSDTGESEVILIDTYLSPAELPVFRSIINDCVVLRATIDPDHVNFIDEYHIFYIGMVSTNRSRSTVTENL
jgi:hypothetical protein